MASITDRWGTTSYGTLSGILAAPTTIAGALAPWAGAALAATLGGYPALFLILTFIVALAAILAAGSIPGRGGPAGGPSLGEPGLSATLALLRQLDSSHNHE